MGLSDEERFSKLMFAIKELTRLGQKLDNHIQHKWPISDESGVKRISNFLYIGAYEYTESKDLDEVSRWIINDNLHINLSMSVDIDLKDLALIHVHLEKSC